MGDHCLPRWSLKEIPSAFSLFSSRLGVFKSVVTFPACKEPLTDLEEADTIYRIPTLFVFSFAWTLQLMLQLAKGVALCHRVGVVHRDLEPWNVMFDRLGRLKLIDFGFARQMVRCLPLSSTALPSDLSCFRNLCAFRNKTTL
jgi:serine/threonine protein kinase